MTMNPSDQYTILFADHWEAARAEVRDLDRCEANWDGEGADPVPLKLIQATLRYLEECEQLRFLAPDTVYAAADGTVFVEWHYPDGFVQVVNLCLNRILVITMDPDGKIIPVPTDNISDVITSNEMIVDIDRDRFEFTLAA